MDKDKREFMIAWALNRASSASSTYNLSGRMVAEEAERAWKYIGEVTKK